MIPGSVYARVPDRTSWLARLHPATKVIALPLAWLTCLLVPAWAVVPLLAMVVLALYRRGLRGKNLITGLRAWWLLILLVLAIHTFTTPGAASLGHPTLKGLLRGATLLGRVAGSLGCLALFLRATPLVELTAGLSWWGRPLARRRASAAPMSLVLAVALGTVPHVLSEGRRIEAVVRLRRGVRDATAGHKQRPWRHWWTHWWRRVLDRGYLVVPLLESLLRKADSLTLALKDRLPRPADGQGRPPWREWAALAVWALLLAAGVWR
jgi:energy-coupling factor transporter transmembrane protein EcfT